MLQGDKIFKVTKGFGPLKRPKKANLEDEQAKVLVPVVFDGFCLSVVGYRGYNTIPYTAIEKERGCWVLVKTGNNKSGF